MTDEASPEARFGSVGMAVANSALLLMLLVLMFEPMRSAFGNATALWHPCVPSAGGGAGYERWSPILLLVVLGPVAGGFVAWGRVRSRAGLAAVVASVLLLLLALGLVLVPSGSCIA